VSDEVRDIINAVVLVFLMVGLPTLIYFARKQNEMLKDRAKRAKGVFIDDNEVD